MDKLIRFLDIDPAATRHAAAIWSLIEHRIEHIKVKQKDHWRALFESRLDLQYFNSASLIGIKHSEIGLDPKWYIASYARIKGDFSRTILNAPLSLPTKADLVVTLDKYVALDMALAISSYTSLLVD